MRQNTATSSSAPRSKPPRDARARRAVIPMLRRRDQMSEDQIRYEAADGIAVITIDRPAKGDALTTAMCEDLHAAWGRFAASDDERVAILTAVGNDVFTAGA